MMFFSALKSDSRAPSTKSDMRDDELPSVRMPRAGARKCGRSARMTA
jgi:hypothetical protein